MNVNWNINGATILAVIAMGMPGLIWTVTLGNKVDEMERFRASRTVQTDKNFADINAKLANQADLPYRVGQNEGAIKATNERIDRIADSFLGTAETIKTNVNKLSTQFELMSQKMDTFIGQKKAEITPQTYPAVAIP